jgi:hypothetical protein
MTRLNNPDDPKLEELLDKLADVPMREARAAAEGRARFLAQARELAPAVSSQPDRRHTGWNKNFFERIWKTMKTKSVLSTLAVVIVLAMVVVFTANNVSNVSAQQVLDRAASAQSAAEKAQGIWHVQIEDYENPQFLEGDQPGTKTMIDSYVDIATGHYRDITRNAAGKIVSINALDGSFDYWMAPVTGDRSDGPLTVSRVRLTPENSKIGRPGDYVASTKAVFDQFRSNPRVEMEGKVAWIDGSQAYVLVADNYQTHKPLDGQDGKTLIGRTKMVFNAKTYELLESQTSIIKNGKDIVINSVRFLVNEILPAGSPVTWDLSDLPGVVFVDDTSTQQAEVLPVAISEQELASHDHTYLLKTIPEGFTMEIIAAPNQPTDQPYAYEVIYKNQAGETFDMLAVGIMEPGFVESNFYDGSYKTASGLVLNFSPSGTSAMLTTPDGISFLVSDSISRERLEALVEDVIPTK